jgi:hypothetical protein
MMRKALLLPALFLIVLTPIVLFVESDSATDMSALMLYPFASPWWMVLPYMEPNPNDVLREHGRPLGGDAFRLLTGFAINVAVLAALGLFWDTRTARR